MCPCQAERLVFSSFSRGMVRVMRAAWGEHVKEPLLASGLVCSAGLPEASIPRGDCLGAGMPPRFRNQCLWRQAGGRMCYVGTRRAGRG